MPRSQTRSTSAFVTFISVTWLLASLAGLAAEKDREFQIGVAKIDITPGFPIRLSGYASRKTESTGTEQKLWAKALAIGSNREGAVVLLTVDNCGVCANVTEEVAARLKKKAGIARERFAVCSSHTHTGPCVVGFAPNIFAMPIPDDQQATIARYTKELTDKLEQVALAALKDRRPGKLAWGQTSVGFAANRRTAGGPTDHSVPVLRATDREGRLRAVVANYACHCTTLGGEFNKFCPDWAGFAQLELERAHPGAITLVTIGCGADSNPQPRGGSDFGLALSQQHGQSLAKQVSALLTQPMIPLRQKPTGRTKRIALPFQPHFTREQWEQRATNSAIVGYHAKKYLARLDRGEKLPRTLPYLVQTWTFGDDLAMVFLGGEVVVDYSLRLKRELDSSRLWVTAYANDVPCYIPSRRILKEGGYEAETSLWYYDRPQQLAPETEDLIIRTVRELLPRKFAADQAQSEFPPPKSPAEALASIHTKAGLEVELVASEPLIVDPVAIDWGADGKLWVVEMRDYPMGMDGKWKPGGRVKLLEDLNRDGKFDRRDKATVFLDGIPFPTGVMAWRKGALVCAAPDILYAEDTDADGKADVVKKLFSGFYTDNYQARVNSLSVGLDNWIHGANGLLGGVIRGAMSAQEVNIRGQDFRMNLDSGRFEPVSGLTQQGRVRDDWGNWFGCDNSTLLRHYPLPDHYLRRNPHVAAPNPAIFVPSGGDPNQLFPNSRTLTRFNDAHTANRTTSACGLGLYRDDLLGDEYYGNAFVCEPVHNLVHRLVLETNGVTFAGHRAMDEQRSEFLASTDNWFRPVQVRTGPDGALWVVDMYRYLIEHPRWIPADRLAQFDARAGDDKGRIYRVYPHGRKPGAVRNLNKLSPTELVAALDSPNGTERDRVQIHLLDRRDHSTAAGLIKVFQSSHHAAARLQALWLMDSVLKPIPTEILEQALTHLEPAIRRHALRLSEPQLSNEASGVEKLRAAVLARTNDPDVSVRFQFALTLGEWNDPRAGKALGTLAKSASEDKWLRAAVLSSATWHSGEILAAALALPENSAGRSELITQLISTAAGSDNQVSFKKVFAAIQPAADRDPTAWQVNSLASLLDALERKTTLTQTGDEKTINPRPSEPGLDRAFLSARNWIRQASVDEDSREAAIHLLGRAVAERDEDLKLLIERIDRPGSTRLQNAALTALRRSRDPRLPGLLLAEWSKHPPALRREILSLLLARNEWTETLLKTVAAGVIQPSEIALADRQRLLQHSDEQIRRQASGLFAAQQGASRAQVVAQFQSALSLPGHSAHGAEIFGKTCASCHAFRGQGFDVGPNLAALRDKDAAYWLKNILDPNAAIEPRFINYQIETRDGRSLSGIVSTETSTSLALVQAGGVQERILRADIASIQASALSSMPEGLEQNLTAQNFADLIAYLKTTPAHFGSPPDEQAAQARKQFLAESANGFMHLFFSGEKLAYPSWLGTLPMPHCRQTDGQSKLVWQTRPVPQGLRSSAFHRFRLPAAMGFASQPAGKFQLKLNDKPVVDFDVSLFDHVWQSADGAVRMTYSVMQNNREDSNGILEIEVKDSLLQPGSPVTFEVTGSAANSQRWFGIYVL